MTSTERAYIARRNQQAAARRIASGTSVPRMSPQAYVRQTLPNRAMVEQRTT